MQFWEASESYVLLQGMDVHGWEKRYPGQEPVPGAFVRGILERRFPAGRGLNPDAPQAPDPHRLESLLRALEQRHDVLLQRKASAPSRASSPGPVARVRSAPQEVRPETRSIRLHVQTMSGEPLEDEEGFWLERPDGTEEKTGLSGGEFLRNNALTGSHRAHFRLLVNARWSVKSAAWGDEVTLQVSARRFADGTSLTFQIYDADHPEDAAPLHSVEGKVTSGWVETRWRLPREVKMPVRAAFVFEVASGKKWAASDALSIRPGPVTDVKGQEDRLLHLGYDALADRTKALKAFQESTGVLAVTGVADDATLELLESLT